MLKRPLTALVVEIAVFAVQQNSVAAAATDHQLSGAFAAALAVLDLIAVAMAAVAARVGTEIGAGREAAAVVTVAATAGIVIVTMMMMSAVFADVWIAKAVEIDSVAAAAAYLKHYFAGPKVAGVVAVVVELAAEPQKAAVSVVKQIVVIAAA